MTAVVYTGADFRAKSLRTLKVQEPALTETVDVSCLKSDGVTGKRALGSSYTGADRGLCDPAAGSNPACGTIDLAYCDFRTLQEVERAAARYAEDVAKRADRVADPQLKAALANIAEMQAEQALCFRRLLGGARPVDAASSPGRTL